MNCVNIGMHGATIKKATISFVTSICLAVCLSTCLPNRTSVRLSAWNNSAPTGRIFMIFDICVFFETVSRKIKSKSGKNSGYFS